MALDFLAAGAHSGLALVNTLGKLGAEQKDGTPRVKVPDPSLPLPSADLSLFEATNYACHDDGEMRCSCVDCFKTCVGFIPIVPVTRCYVGKNPDFSCLALSATVIYAVVVFAIMCATVLYVPLKMFWNRCFRRRRTFT